MTAKEEALQLQKVWADGCGSLVDGTPLSTDTRRRCAETAKMKFPLPKLTRPRELTQGGFTFRVVNGDAEWATVGRGDWTRLVRQEMTTANLARLKLLVDLLEHPTEEVDDE